MPFIFKLKAPELDYFAQHNFKKEIPSFFASYLLHLTIYYTVTQQTTSQPTHHHFLVLNPTHHHFLVLNPTHPHYLVLNPTHPHFLVLNPTHPHFLVLNHTHPHFLVFKIQPTSCQYIYPPPLVGILILLTSAVVDPSHQLYHYFIVINTFYCGIMMKQIILPQLNYTYSS